MFISLTNLELVHQLRDLEEALNERNRQLHATSEQRRDYDRLTNKLADWIKGTEQQVKEPFSNDLQQSIGALKDKSKTVQVSSIEVVKRNRLSYLVIATINTRSPA